MTAAQVTFDLNGLVMVVTGATGNLGQAVAQAAQAAGAQVALVDRNAERQTQFYGDLDDSRHFALADVDVTNTNHVERAMTRIAERFGRIDALVHTVGGFAAGKPVHETPLEMWDAMLEMNARSTFVVLRTAVPHMLAQKSGRIVTIGAGAGEHGVARLSGYAASKAAVINLTQTLAAEVGKQGVNVNCVLPGTIDTPENRAAMPKADYSKWVTPESLARVILFLCSEGARDIHGASIPVTGAG